jgi:peptidoglycan/xylan/chitin deacetylase (PgdA/CDA1 family)
MNETLLAFTNDDAGMQEPERFAELLDFLAQQEVPATLFVVPAAGDRPLSQVPRWVALLNRALAEGHDLQVHGLTHRSAFEFGVPPSFILDIMPEQKAQWERAPARFRADHSYAVLAEKLTRGREILIETFGCTPRGFRSPCLSVCDNLYRALHDLGFQWSSNQVVNPAGWHYIERRYDTAEPWQPEVPPRPHRHPSGVIEAPMCSEYSWYLTDADVQRHFQLARDDFDRCRANGDPFVVLSHYFAMTGKWSAGLRVYERLFAHARAQGSVRFATLSELIAQHASAAE